MFLPGEVDHDCHVDQQDADAQRRLPSEHLHQLKRNPDAPSDDGQVLGPAAPPRQADRLCDLEQSEENGADADDQHRAGRELADRPKDRQEHARNQPPLGVDVELGDPLANELNHLVAIRQEGDTEHRHERAADSTLEDDQPDHGIDRLCFAAELPFNLLPERHCGSASSSRSRSSSLL